MTITELTREMITDYEAIIGRKLTPQEYLQFREQAMREIQNGFYPATTQHSAPISYVPMVQEQKVEVSKITQTTNAPTIMEQKITVPEEKTSPKQLATKKEVVEKEIKLKTDTQAEDPFFALIDKMDA